MSREKNNIAPTLEDVARLSGVSTATVSRVLNAPAKVKEATRRKVQEAVAALGYTPNFGARALASNRTDTIGAVIPTMENAIFAQGLQALQEELAEAGVTLLVATSGYDADREAEQIRTLVGRGVDGLALIGEARAPEVYDFLQARGVPFALAWHWRRDCPWPCVGFDNRAAAAAMAERALILGHRRIAMLGGLTRWNDRATARIEGVRQAVAAAGGAVAVAEAEYTLEAATEAARGLIRSHPDATVILCGNDVLAAGAVRAAREEGLSVPRDLSIAGFDDIELARLIDPPLTTVRLPHRRMGQAIARLLLGLRENPDGGESVVFAPEIIERSSMGPPRA